MCIIVYKPIGEKLPQEDILRKCFDNNSDGAGFMYANRGAVYIKKGYMSFDKFYKALKTAVRDNGEKEIPYVLHFRISTQGGERKDCTHPFPLSSNMRELRKLNTITNIGIAHNGIIDLTSKGSKAKVDYSDTMEFITEYLTLIIKNEKFYTDKKAIKLIEKLGGWSRFTILDKNGDCTLIGKGWILDNNIYYSNTSYKANYIYSNNSFYDKEFEEISEKYDHYYNADYDLYEFDEGHCPFFEEGIDSYCPACMNYSYCCGY